MLNILQAVKAGYPRVTEETVYTCVGAPLPGDINLIAQWLFNEHFDSAYSSKLLVLFCGILRSLN
jgi:replication factor C subunit 3/5